jgi:hypothetical protein
MRLSCTPKEYEDSMLKRIRAWAKEGKKVDEDFILTLLLASAAISNDGEEVYKEGCKYLAILSYLQKMLKDYPDSTPEKTIPAAIDKEKQIQWRVDNGYICVYNTHTKWNGEKWVRE